MIGTAVDEKRLERCEEHPCRIADTRHRLRFGADGVPQLLQHKRATGRIFSAQEATLELRDQHRPCLRLERPQIFSQSLDGLPVGRHCTPVSPGLYR